jgi:hypothetical protein
MLAKHRFLPWQFVRMGVEMREFGIAQPLFARDRGGPIGTVVAVERMAPDEPGINLLVAKPVPIGPSAMAAATDRPLSAISRIVAASCAPVSAWRNRLTSRLSAIIPFSPVTP